METKKLSQKDRLNFLILELLKEKGVKAGIPQDLQDKHRIYKILCNTRQPKSLSKEFIEVERDYLQERLKDKKITDINDIPPLYQTHQFLVNKNKIKNIQNICLWKGDITKLKIDAIVNAGNSDGLGCFQPNHICIDNIIHSEAGACLRLECYEHMKKIKILQNGEVFMTSGCNLPCKKVIHTVGPCIENGCKPVEGDINELGNCYTNSLKELVKNNLFSIAFPAISTGIFGFPKNLAAKIAIEKIDEFISELEDNYRNKIKVVIDVFDDENINIYEKVLREL